jgi:U3 small nucleolar RNA-associated protein 22
LPQVLLGVTLDPTAAMRPVDMGPAAEDTAAAADFRAFWGNKAELRRFPVRLSSSCDGPT